MATDAILHQRLTDAQRRVRALITYRWVARLLCAVLSVCLAWLLASKAQWVPEPAPLAVVLAAVAAALVGAAIGMTRPLTRMDVARLTDARTAMRERLATAVELEPLAGGDPLVAQQVADAREHAQALDLRRVYPFRLRREGVAALLIGVVLFAAFFLPTMPIFWSKEKRAEMAQVKTEGVHIVKVANDAEKNAAQHQLPETKKAAQEARKLAEAMRKGNLSKKEAMIQMQKLTAKMEAQQKRMAAATQPPAKTMEQAAAEFKKSLEQRQAEIAAASKTKTALQKNGLKPGQQPGQKGMDAQNPQKMSAAMQQAQQNMEQLAQAMGQQNPGAMQQAMDQLAKQLQSGHLTRQEMSQLQKQMDSLSKALSQTQMDQLAKQMQTIAEAMKKAGITQKDLQKIAERLRKTSNLCKNCSRPGPGGKMVPMDAEQLAKLLAALKDGRLQLCSGSCNGKGLGLGTGKGMGLMGGVGSKTDPMKGSPAGNPKMTAIGKNNASTMGGRASREFAKYAGMGTKPIKHAPNTMVRGTPNGNDTELVNITTGDPTVGAHGNVPYYEVITREQKALESPVSKENIPAAYRRQVKKYFEDIKP